MALPYTNERNTIRVQAGVSLPLTRSAVLQGDVGHGRCVPLFVAMAHGVYVSRRGRMSLYAHGLREEIWRKETGTWGDLRAVGTGVICGPTDDGVTRRYDGSGEVVAEVQAHGALHAADEACVVTSSGGELVATEWSGRVRWTRKSLPNHVLLDGMRTFLVEDIGCRLVCLDSATGAEEWELRAPENRKQPTDWYLAGFPSVSIARGRLVVIGRDGMVQLVDRESGSIKAMVVPPYIGSFLVSETDAYFFRLSGWSRLDLATLTEVERQEYDAEVAHMQGRVFPTAFWLSEESVFWTTLGGQVMGVSRKPDPSGKRVWWSDDLHATLAIAVPPVHVGRHLYVKTAGRRGSPGELVCYETAL